MSASRAEQIQSRDSPLSNDWTFQFSGRASAVREIYMIRAYLLSLVLVLVAGGGFLIARSSGESMTQPIAFNHKKHIDNDLECSACHGLFQTTAHAGRPATETCMLCHETALTDSKEEEKIRSYAEQGEQIPWRRLFKLPQHVYFSHQTHVVSGQVECKSCHGSIGESTSPPSQPEIKLTMSGCINCHKTRGASTDCLACHK